MGKPHIIICEGKEAMRFIYWFLEHLVKSEPQYDSFEPRDGKGISQLANYISVFSRTPEFRTTCRSITVLRDYEYDKQKNPAQSLKDAFKRAGLFFNCTF